MQASNLEKITELRHKLHSHAELSLQEIETKRILMDFISENTSLEVCDQGEWFYAFKDGQGDNPIAFRADMDALPIPETIELEYSSQTEGVSHKCGHDGHSAALCGLALELDSMEDIRPVYLIFQHAEEIGVGGKVCSELLQEKDITEVYAFHNRSGYPEGSVIYRRGLIQPASEGLTIKLTGARSHASDPELGRNPSHIVGEILSLVHEIPERPHRGLVLCTVVHLEVGTKDFGISAGEGEISLTLRAEHSKDLNYMEQEICDLAEQLGQEEDIEVEFTRTDIFPDTKNSAFAVDHVISVAESLGYDTIPMEKLWRSSEDFGYYTKKCHGAIFYIGNGRKHPPVHTVEYDFNDRILSNAVDMFLGLIQY